LGACPKCRGFGRVIEIDYRLAMPDHSLSIHQGAIKCWESEVYGDSKKDLLAFAKKKKIRPDVPFASLPEDQQRFIVDGEPGYGEENGKSWPKFWYGLKGFFRWLMAATLAWIKSRMLLPPERSEEDDEGGDPRAELVARLLEYQRYKEAAEQLGDRALEGRDVFAARSPEIEPPPDDERPLAVSMVALLEAFRRVLLRSSGKGLHEVTTEPIHVRDRMIAVMDALGSTESLEFEQIFELEPDRQRSRALLVATFLAILELVRLAAVRVYQSFDAAGVPEGPIRLRRAEGADADDWSQAVAEIT
jgi:chromatin segregation and condensation protein Rec8/ScpA/Scc1 (kleisin family)